MKHEVNRLLGPVLRFLLAGLLLATSAAARDVVVVTGRGASEADAIKEALAEAVRQVNGTTVETDTRLSRVVQDSIDGIRAHFTAKTEDFQHIRTVSGGFVRSYEVLESDAPARPTTVRVRATVLRFDPKNPRPGSAKTLVVSEFTLAPGALAFDREVVGAEELLGSLRDELETDLVNSRKFLVLTRSDMGRILEELRFIEGQWVGAQEKVKLRNLYGADYLVTGRIDALVVHTETKVVKLTGYRSESKTARIGMTLSVYNVGSGRIEWTERYDRDHVWPDAELKASPELRDDADVAQSMVRGAATFLTHRLILRTFRPEVVKVKSDVPGGPILVLNAGSALCAVDDVFELVLLGEPLIDPATGLSLGPDETFIGLVRITRQDDRKSEAVFVEPTEELRRWIAEVDPLSRTLACRPHELGE